jgi:hypothetical protein
MFLAAMILAATIVSPTSPVSPLSPDQTRSVTVTKGAHQVDIVRDLQGKIVRMVVRRTDGKAMSNCEAYSATLEHTYGCQSGDCTNGWSVATGVGYGASEEDACSAAKAEMCQNASCSYGSYQYCATTMTQVYTLAGEQGGGCVYYGSGSCFISADCN